MATTINDLKPQVGSKKRRKRVGRGNASCGSYSGKGMKGQKARTGMKLRESFEGGQTPFLQRMPKLKGFKNINNISYFSINLDLLSEKYNDGEEVNIVTLLEKRILRGKKTLYKILGNGELTKKLTIKADKFSKTAEEKITKAKGSFETLVRTK